MLLSSETTTSSSSSQADAPSSSLEPEDEIKKEPLDEDERALLRSFRHGATPPGRTRSKVRIASETSTSSSADSASPGPPSVTRRPKGDWPYSNYQWTLATLILTFRVVAIRVNEANPANVDPRAIANSVDAGQPAQVRDHTVPTANDILAKYRELEVAYHFVEHDIAQAAWHWDDEEGVELEDENDWHDFLSTYPAHVRVIVNRFCDGLTKVDRSIWPIINDIFATGPARAKVTKRLRALSPEDAVFESQEHSRASLSDSSGSNYVDGPAKKRAKTTRAPRVSAPGRLVTAQPPIKMPVTEVAPIRLASGVSVLPASVPAHGPTPSRAKGSAKRSAKVPSTRILTAALPAIPAAPARALPVSTHRMPAIVQRPHYPPLADWPVSAEWSIQPAPFALQNRTRNKCAPIISGLWKAPDWSGRTQWSPPPLVHRPAAASEPSMQQAGIVTSSPFGISALISQRPQILSTIAHPRRSTGSTAALDSAVRRIEWGSAQAPLTPTREGATTPTVPASAPINARAPIESMAPFAQNLLLNRAYMHSSGFATTAPTVPRPNPRFHPMGTFAASAAVSKWAPLDRAHSGQLVEGLHPMSTIDRNKIAPRQTCTMPVPARQRRLLSLNYAAHRARPVDARRHQCLAASATSTYIDLTEQEVTVSRASSLGPAQPCPQIHAAARANAPQQQLLLGQHRREHLRATPATARRNVAPAQAQQQAHSPQVKAGVPLTPATTPEPVPDRVTVNAPVDTNVVTATVSVPTMANESRLPAQPVSPGLTAPSLLSATPRPSGPSDHSARVSPPLPSLAPAAHVSRAHAVVADKAASPAESAVTTQAPSDRQQDIPTSSLTRQSAEPAILKAPGIIPIERQQLACRNLCLLVGRSDLRDYFDSERIAEFSSKAFASLPLAIFLSDFKTDLDPALTVMMLTAGLAAS
ncbi:hypothetical protein E5Q_05365 [Mixia osmundae IAM 14324]|uniref:Uncharacterized protein n=1 Tax=Mixia osmundae (strain CBS 9802 / IAM 14324 / JCM 22182 / KY 12970) TaxID=764103 RepID=G7E767_MIXOS|nr:hypothetical protein E5Q_05365 [Mixia osmundae IAM 14324]